MSTLREADSDRVPDPVAEETLRRMTAGACAAVLWIAPGYVALWWSGGDPVTAAVIATALLLAAMTRMALARGRDPRRMAWLMVVTVTAMVACGTWRSGGPGTIHATWFLVLPLFATYLFGPAGCLAVSTTCLATLSGMWAWQIAWGVPEPHLSPIFQDVFEMVHVVGIALAISMVTIQWRRTALYERRRRLELRDGLAQAFDTMRDAVMVFESSGAVEIANPAARALEAALPGRGATLGDWLREATGRPPVELPDRDAWPALRHPGDGRCFDLRARAWSGRTVVTLYDVSLRAATEAELRRATEEAQAASRAKSEFLANLSHEVRTPMSGILGMTELALTDARDEAMRERLATIQRCGRSMLGLLNDVLDLSRIEAGHMELVQEEFDLRSVLDEVVDTFRSSAELAELELRLSVPANLPGMLLGDAQRLRQVLLNLVGNALKFTEQGRVDLEAEVVRQGAGSATLRLSVRDTGVGIPEADLPRLFEKFTRGRSPDGRTRGGTGLGLTISREIVERMGGTLAATSEVGSGSCFRVEIELPVVDPRLPVGEADALVGRRVLVVDGDADRQRQAARRLRRLGCRYEYGGPPREALARLRHAAEAGDPYWAVLAADDATGHDVDALEAQLRLDLKCAAVPVLRYGRTPLRQARLAEQLLDLVATENGAGDASRPPAKEPGSGPVPHVLLVEDNEVNRVLLATMLERLGCTIEAANDGVDGVAAATRGGFDLIFMDCQMPRMDGYAATRAIRELPGEAGAVPIVALTASAVDGDRERCLQAGMDDYLSKPLQGAQLAAVLRRWVPSTRA